MILFRAPKSVKGGTMYLLAPGKMKRFASSIAMLAGACVILSASAAAEGLSPDAVAQFYRRNEYWPAASLARWKALKG